jgi:hypothetical protein
MDMDAPTSVGCGCPPSRGRIRLLDGELGLTFAVSGLIVQAEVWELSNRSLEDVEFRITDKAQRLMTTEGHEYIHYLQAVGSCYLQWHARQQLLAGFGLLRWGPSRRSYLEGYRDLGRALSKRESCGLSCLDILESGAVLGGYKMLRERWRKPIGTDEAVQGFVPELERHRSNPDSRRYHAAFDWLEGQIGFQAAYHLYDPLSFLAFNTEHPPKAFTDAGRRLGRWGGRLARQLVDAELSKILDALDAGTPWLADRQNLTVPPEELTPTTEAAFHIVDVFGLYDALELIVRPWHLDRDAAPQWATDAVAPLAMVWSSAVGLIEAQLSDLASQDHRVLARAMHFCAVIGAAERISAAEAGNLSVHRSCPHVKCPHYGPALCHHYYLPPPLVRHHDTCDFIATLDQAFGKTSAEIWSEWGLPGDAALTGQ